MLGPHLPSLPPAPSEGRSTPCAFGIPDGSYRCLALEAEESGGEEGQQCGESGAMSVNGYKGSEMQDKKILEP